jgi:hypothetical protein
LKELQQQFQRLREANCDKEGSVLEEIEEELQERKGERGEAVR